MKKMIFALVGSALLLTACSRENKLNKILDGEWNVTELDNQPMPSGTTGTIKFEAGSKGTGNITSTFTVTGIAQPMVSTGTYELEEDTKMTTFVGNDTSVVTVVSYSKTDLHFRDMDNSNLKATKK